MFKSDHLLKSLKSKALLIKLLLSYLGTAIVSILLITLLFSYWMKNESIANINDLNTLALSSISTLASNTFDVSKSNAYEIYNNSSVRNLLFTPKNNEIFKVEIATFTARLRVSNPSLYSINICNVDSIVFTSSGSIRNREDFEALLPIIKKSRVLHPIPRKIKDTNGDLINVFTLVYHQANAEDRLIDSAVVVDIKANDLYSQIYREFNNVGQELMLADDEGNILLHNNKELFGRNIKDEQYFQNVLNTGSNSGFFTLKDKERGDFIYSYIRSADSNFFVISASEYDHFFTSTIKRQNSIIVACIIIIFLVILMSIPISRALYSPLNNVITNIRSLFKGTAGSDRPANEFRQISQAVGSLIEKLNTLENDNKNSSMIIKNNFIKSLFTSKAHDPEVNLKEKLESFDILDGDHESILIAVLRVDSYAHFFSSNTKDAIDFQLSSIANITGEAIRSICKSTPVVMDPEHIAIIAAFGGSDPNPDTGLLEDTLKKCQDTIKQIFSLEVTIGISDMTRNIFEIGERYSLAFGYTNYRLVYGKGSIFSSRSIKTGDAKNVKVNQLIDSITGAARNNLHEEYISNIRELFSSIKNGSYDKIIGILLKLANSIYRIPVEIQPNYMGNYESDIQELYGQMKSFESYSDTEAWFDDLFIRTVNVLSVIKNKKTPDLIDNITRYIDENYSEYFLSANYMADRLSISPQYFSKIFNEHTNMSFPDYVNNIRLEKAKKLILSDPDLSISEICQRVGYNNRTYFSSSFTRKFGCSPMKFKNSSNITKLI